MHNKSVGVPVISVVSPIFGRELDLQALYDRLVHSLSDITTNFEIIFVNDRSPDDSWEKTLALSQQDPRVRGILLSKNYGQHRAISAGLDHVRGQWCVVMDCDLQDLPEEIPALYNCAIKGNFEVVVGRRSHRNDSLLVRATSRIFYYIFNFLTDQKLNHEAANFGIYSRKVIQAIKRFSESDRSFSLLVNLVGFRREELIIRHSERTVGQSSYSFGKRFNLAVDLILSHSTKPLRITMYFGMILSFIAFIYGLYIMGRYFMYGSQVSGWASLIVATVFLSGLIIIVLGMIGLYIGKIFQQVKMRPLYLIDTTTWKE